MSRSFLAIILAAGCLLIASSCAKTPERKIWTEFSGDRALAHVQALVDLGPRPPGSDAIVRARAYIEEQLESSGWNVTEQAFSDQTPRGEAKFVNLIARFGGASKPVFLLCSHYDTKIFNEFSFVGANDGGSSTGLLLELARVLALQPDLAKKIELVFFDGEEAVENFSATDGIYGSRHFAQELVKDRSAKSFRGGLLFDMIADKSLDVTLPPNSPSKITAGIFASADALKLRNYFTYFDQDITDDHSPLNAVGIPVVDLIDFHYPPWHTAEDTMDKLSPQSLQVVGSVAAYYLSQLAFK
jgi:Zn-dependent M28 family amino/carboxypeptidase